VASDATKVQAVPLASLAGAGITGTYQLVSATFPTTPVKQLLLYNGTNQLLTFSLDGTDDHLVVPASATMILDFESNGSNSYPGQRPWRLAKGQPVFVKGAAGTGSVYLMGLY